MSNKKASFWMSPKGLAAMGLIAAASYFLLMEHRQHVWQYLPFLILLACPFMHLFMHGGHGGHGETNGKEENSANAEHKTKDYQRGLEEGRKQSNQDHSH